MWTGSLGPSQCLRSRWSMSVPQASIYLLSHFGAQVVATSASSSPARQLKQQRQQDGSHDMALQPEHRTASDTAIGPDAAFEPRSSVKVCFDLPGLAVLRLVLPKSLSAVFHFQPSSLHSSTHVAFVIDAEFDSADFFANQN